jgi:hypothetical protein
MREAAEKMSMVESEDHILPVKERG